jgi:hypothetical protein
LFPEGRLALIFGGMARPGSAKLFCGVSPTRAGLLARLVLAAVITPVPVGIATAAQMLQVEVPDGLPGFPRADLQRFLALHMAESRLADWRFEPAPIKDSAPDRVEWKFRLNPYAGGEVRSFGRSHTAQSSFATHRPITIEALLYLNGEYQTLVERQAVTPDGPNDPEFGAAVVSVTQNLLGSQGALRAIESGRPPVYGPR